MLKFSQSVILWGTFREWRVKYGWMIRKSFLGEWQLVKSKKLREVEGESKAERRWKIWAWQGKFVDKKVKIRGLNSGSDGQSLGEWQESLEEWRTKVQKIEGKCFGRISGEVWGVVTVCLGKWWGEVWGVTEEVRGMMVRLQLRTDVTILECVSCYRFCHWRRPDLECSAFTPPSSTPWKQVSIAHALIGC